MGIYRTHTCGELRKGNVGEKVILSGWVRRVRDLGGLLFMDLRDRYGQVQVVFEPGTEAFEVTKKIGLQYVVRVEGKVRERPGDMINPKLPTGEIEVLAESIEILNTSPPTPFVIEDGIKIQEETRLRYRFLDLRRPEMQRNIILRHRMTFSARKFLDSKGFLEIETPYLAKSTPEGARDFLVPSRIYPGRFYALPQSPQLYKQVLMSSGFDRYFQIVRCFRDEDLRADRQPEFTQIDIEMSFIDEEDIISLTEELMVTMFKEGAGIEVESPFIRLSYKEALLNYGTDKPDLRYNLKLVTVTEDFKNTGHSILKRVIEEGGEVITLPLPLDLTRREIGKLEEEVRKEGAPGILWFKRKEGSLSGPLSKFIPQEFLKNFGGEYITFILIAEKSPRVYELGGFLINRIIEEGHLEPETKWKFVWVTDFPLFVWNEEEKRIEPSHHMFTMPKEGGIEDIEQNPLSLIGKQYDLVLNGVEIASGSIRVHRRDLQEKIMEIIGLSHGEIRERFGFLLEALDYGAPPHGGIAIGLDRLIAMAAGRSSIRDVIAFPKTTKAQALYEGSPSEVGEDQLKELHIKIEREY
jgi:aspartyl-tRNA synthetase